METTDVYNTIASQIAEGFYSEKRSKFYAFAFHVESEEEVKTIVQAYGKRFYDARHVCWAYVLGADGSVSRANDDGEPSSTAGKPILGQIVKNGLTDILVIVVRYFGGVKLDTLCGGDGGVRLLLCHDERCHARGKGNEAAHRVARLRQLLPHNT